MTGGNVITCQKIVYQNVLTLSDIGFEAPRMLLARYRLDLVEVENGQPIPGSFWGDCEAGIIGLVVY
ncbi:MAG TPA: hypothetical protein PK135_11640, partial [Arenimonas sp.]|nr:hypothetical protein [Arenimonas sp.]